MSTLPSLTEEEEYDGSEETISDPLERIVRVLDIAERRGSVAAPNLMTRLNLVTSPEKNQSPTIPIEEPDDSLQSRKRHARSRSQIVRAGRKSLDSFAIGLIPKSEQELEMQREIETLQKKIEQKDAELQLAAEIGEMLLQQEEESRNEAEDLLEQLERLRLEERQTRSDYETAVQQLNEYKRKNLRMSFALQTKESEFADTLRDWQQKISVQQEQKESLQALTAENNRLREMISSLMLEMQAANRARLSSVDTWQSEAVSNSRQRNFSLDSIPEDDIDNFVNGNQESDSEVNDNTDTEKDREDFRIQKLEESLSVAQSALAKANSELEERVKTLEEMSIHRNRLEELLSETQKQVEYLKQSVEQEKQRAAAAEQNSQRVLSKTVGSVGRPQVATNALSLFDELHTSQKSTSEHTDSESPPSNTRNHAVSLSTHLSPSLFNTKTGSVRIYSQPRVCNAETQTEEVEKSSETQESPNETTPLLSDKQRPNPSFWSNFVCCGSNRQ